MKNFLNDKEHQERVKTIMKAVCGDNGSGILYPKGILAASNLMAKMRVAQAKLINLRMDYYDPETAARAKSILDGNYRGKKVRVTNGE